VQSVFTKYGNDSNGKVDYIQCITKATSIPKYQIMQYPSYNLISNPNSTLIIWTVPKMPSDSQVSFQPLTENKDLPCTVVGDSWALVGLLLKGNHEGRRRITGNHWQTCQPLGRWRGRPRPNPALPTMKWSSVMFRPPLYFLFSRKKSTGYTFLSKDNFCWPVEPVYYGARCNAFVIKSQLHSELCPLP